MNKYNACNTFNKQVEDTSEKCRKKKKALCTVSVSEDLANVIKDLSKLKLSACSKENLPWIYFSNDNVLDKMEIPALNVPKRQRGVSTNMHYLSELESLEEQPGATEILKRRQRLPIYESTEQILEKIGLHQVTVVYGESGCGKTTQIPQYILDHAIKSHEGSMCKIACAVPRRMSAIHAAKQVAEERDDTVGHDSSVGYHISNDNKSARSNASITYFTQGVLLRLMLKDPFLNEVSHIVLDEVQERDMITDFLLRLIKKLIEKRTNIKVIVLCTTVYHEEFVTYFNNCAKVQVPGFRYPVEHFYLEDVLARTNLTCSPLQTEETLTRKRSDAKLPKPKSYPKHVQQSICDPNAEKINLDLIVAVITDINYYGRNGAILVFVPGVSDIVALRSILEQSFSDLIVPIHGAIVKDFQMIKVRRDKIYLATNVAESALNLDDVAYVIDTGRVKTRIFDTDNSDSLKFEWISRKNVEQRRRKAGRMGPGKCYHLFQKAIFTVMKSNPAPEITRKNVEEVILKMKLNHLGNPKEFLTKCMTPIPEEDIEKSMMHLQAINVLDINGHLSVKGQTLLRLAMDPVKGKMIYLGILFSCLEPVLTIVAQLTSNPILLESPIRAKQCTSDHLAFYQLLKQYEELEDRNVLDFCVAHNISKYQIAKILDTKSELAAKLLTVHENINYKAPTLNVNAENMNLVRAIVCAGLYPSVAIIRNHNSSVLRNITVVTPEGGPRRFHINSVNAKQTRYPLPLLVYNGIFCCNDRRYLCATTLVTPLSLILFADKLSMIHENSQIFISLSEGLRFRCDKKQTAQVLLQLRKKLDFIIANEINNFYNIDWASDADNIRIMRTVVELLSSEDPGDRFPYAFSKVK